MDFDVKKYASLARIKLTGEEAKNIGEDLKGVLDYFTELQELNTKDTEPMTGGTALKNIFREDEPKNTDLSAEDVVKQFPQSKDGYLKVPKVFGLVQKSKSENE